MSFRELLPMLAIGSMFIGAVFALVLPRDDRRQIRAVGVFALGGAVLLMTYFMDTPSSLASVQEEIALACVSLILFFIAKLKR